MITFPNIFRKLVFLVLSIFIFSTLQYCKSSKNATSNKNEVLVTYTQNIAPLLERSCTPCHFPEQGKKKMLNTFDAVKENITEILMRVQLPVTDEKYMPFKSKRQALTNEEIDVLKKWVKQKMAN